MPPYTLTNNDTSHKEQCIILKAYRQNQYWACCVPFSRRPYIPENTKHNIPDITNIYVMQRLQAQLQTRAEAKLEDMFNAST